MTRSFLTILLIFLLQFHAGAVIRDTSKAVNMEYSNEVGFFQKANRELNDPRFMFRDDVSGIEFGVGGTVQVATSYTFCGSVANYNFIPSQITVPQDVVNSFALKVHGSEFHIKSRATVKKHKVLAFLKIGFNSDYKVELKQAYISFDGFSVGMIPSFFNDLEYGVMTQASVNTQIDKTQPLIGYTFKKDGWELAAAAERADFYLSDYEFHDLSTDFQSIPDFTFHVKKRWNKGHIQFGAVYRNMNYWARTEFEKKINAGENFAANGFGFSLSGNYKPITNLKFSAAVVAGRGIQKYMDIYSGMYLDVAMTDKKVEDHNTVAAVPAWSVALATQYNWTNNLSSSLIGSYARIYRDGNYEYCNFEKSSFQAEANLYWNLDEYGYMGLAYFYGMTTKVPDYINQKQISGHANRIMFVIAYLF